MRRRMPYLIVTTLVIVIVLGVFFISFGAAGGPVSWLLPATTAAQATQRQVRCPPPTQLVPNSFQVKAQRDHSGGTVIFYEARCSAPGQPDTFVEGDSAVQSTWLGWRMTGGSSSAGSLQPRSSTATAFQGISRHTVAAAPQAMAQVQGRLSGTDTTSVEVTLSDGTTRQDAVVDGIFVFTVPDTLSVCAVRALDDAGEVQAEVEMPMPAGPQPGAVPCGP